MHVRATYSVRVYARARARIHTYMYTQSIIIVDIINFRVITLRSRPAIFAVTSESAESRWILEKMHSRVTGEEKKLREAIVARAKRI